MPIRSTMKRSNNLKVLITGALGHIGSRLLRELSAKVDEIVLLDNLESKRFASLYNLPQRKYTFVESDIRTADLDTLLKDIDIVIHLAALSEAEKSVERLKEVEEVNIEGLKRVLDSALKNNVAVIFPSTTSIYGDSVPIITEEGGEIKPQSPYADSKFRGEEIIREYGAKGLSFTIFRFATIYGFSPGMRFSTAVNRFTWQAVLGKPLSVWKTALDQKRPYLYLGDAIQAINLAIDNGIFNNDVYNVHTENLTVKDVVESIKEFVPKVEIELVDSKVMNTASYDLSCDKLKSLGFTPAGNIRDGVKEMVSKFKSLLR